MNRSVNAKSGPEGEMTAERCLELAASFALPLVHQLMSQQLQHTTV